MRNGTGPTFVGYSAIVGGIMGLLLAPVMVIIKYMTGWAIIPEPMWVRAAQEALGGLLVCNARWVVDDVRQPLYLCVVPHAGRLCRVVRSEPRCSRPTSHKGVLDRPCGTVHGDSRRCDPLVDVAPAWLDHPDARHEPVGQHGVCGTHTGMNLIMVGATTAGDGRVAAPFPGTLARVDTCSDSSVGGRGVHDRPSNYAQRCALVVQPDDDRVRLFPCHGQKRTD